MNHHDNNQTTDRRLLILGCSQRKRADPGQLPAIERYNGPRYQTLRKYLKQNPDDPPDVLILSARFCIMAADRPIENYDQIMTFGTGDGTPAQNSHRARQLYAYIRTLPA